VAAAAADVPVAVAETATRPLSVSQI